MRTSRITNTLQPSFEIMGSEHLELESLRQENDLLRKLKAELSIRNRRDNYEKNATIRKHKKQIKKLLQEVNALKVAKGRTLNKSVQALPIRTEKYLFSQGNSLFKAAGQE